MECADQTSTTPAQYSYADAQPYNDGGGLSDSSEQPPESVGLEEPAATGDVLSEPTGTTHGDSVGHAELTGQETTPRADTDNRYG